MSSPDLTTSSMEDSTDGWEGKYIDMRKNYESLEARVVAFAGREYEITDDKIIKQYRRVRDDIDSWIDELQSDEKRQFKACYQENWQRSPREKIFDQLGFAAPSFHRGWEERLGRLETCIYVILGKVISESLRYIFDRPYPLGVTTAQGDLLEHSERAMKTSSPPRDPAMYYRWMGETLSYITLTPDFSTRCEKKTDKIFKDLKADLSEWLGSKVVAKHEVSLREKVLRPAVEAHRMIRCSGKKFDLKYYDHVETPVSKEAMEADIIDIESWRVSRKSEIKGVFGCLVPSLIMRVAIGQRDITFLPPVLLGFKDSTFSPNKSGRSSPTKHAFGNEHGTTDEGQFSERRSLPLDPRGPAPKTHKLWWNFTSRSGDSSQSRSDGNSSGRKGSTSGGPSSSAPSASRSRKHDTASHPRPLPRTPSSRAIFDKTTSDMTPSDEIMYNPAEGGSYPDNGGAYTVTYDPDSSMEGQDGGSEIIVEVEPQPHKDLYFHPPPLQYPDYTKSGAHHHSHSPDR